MAEVDYEEETTDSQVRRTREPKRHVPVIPRKKFIEQFGKEYRPGQHVTMLGPSGRGKTFLGGQLLLSVVKHHRGKFNVSILHGKIKGRDKTIERLSRAGKFPIISKWPPSSYKRRVRHRDNNGWILRPLEKPEESVETENKHIGTEFRRAIRQGYHARKKPVIVVIDEAHQAHNDLKLRKDCEGPLMRGRPMCSMWSFLQRGRYASYMVYDQAEHVFIFYDPDRDNQRRYSEIGGVDPNLLIELSRKLKTETVEDGSTISQCLYFRRSGDILLIVDI